LQEAQLTFFGGVGKSGGVQVMYGKGKQAVLFDFGIEHNSILFPKAVTTFEPVGATPGRELRQYLLGGLTAPLFELYDPDQMLGLDRDKVLRSWKIKKFPHYDQTSLFIGHLHTDHMALLPYARPDIPAYMNNDTYSLYLGMVAGGHMPDTKAKIIACEDLRVIDFGEFTMQIIEMDHNSTGASGIVIDDGTYKIAYTGDWRGHGKHPDMIERFIALCREKKVDILMTEGTRLLFDPFAKLPYQMKESDLLTRFEEIVCDAEGLIYLQMSPRDLERMANMIEISARNGRKIAMESTYAIIWHTAIRNGVRSLACHAALDIDIRIVDASIKAGMPVPYETVTLEEIAANKQDYVYFFKFPDMAHLVEIEALGDPRRQSHYIQSDYGVKLEHEDVAKYLEKYDVIGHSLCNGGHAHPDALADMIERIAPRAAITLHSPYPRSQNTRGINVYHPVKGETASVSSIIANAGR